MHVCTHTHTSKADTASSRTYKQAHKPEGWYLHAAASALKVPQTLYAVYVYIRTHVYTHTNVLNAEIASSRTYKQAHKPEGWYLPAAAVCAYIRTHLYTYTDVCKTHIDASRIFTYIHTHTNLMVGGNNSPARSSKCPQSLTNTHAVRIICMHTYTYTRTYMYMCMQSHPEYIHAHTHTNLMDGSNDSPARSSKCPQSLTNTIRSVCIQPRSRFIQEQYRWVSDQLHRNRSAFTFPARYPTLFSRHSYYRVGTPVI